MDDSSVLDAIIDGRVLHPRSERKGIGFTLFSVVRPRKHISCWITNWWEEKKKTLIGHGQIDLCVHSISRLYSIHCWTIICCHGWYVGQSSQIDGCHGFRSSISDGSYEKCRLVIVTFSICCILEWIESSPRWTEPVEYSTSVARWVLLIS